MVAEGRSDWLIAHTRRLARRPTVKGDRISGRVAVIFDIKIVAIYITPYPKSESFIKANLGGTAESAHVSSQDIWENVGLIFLGGTANDYCY